MHLGSKSNFLTSTLFFCLLVGFLFSACQKEIPNDPIDENLVTLTFTDENGTVTYPMIIQDYIEQEYNAAVLDAIFLVEDMGFSYYEVLLDDGTWLTFNLEGKFLADVTDQHNNEEDKEEDEDEDEDEEEDEDEDEEEDEDERSSMSLEEADLPAVIVDFLAEEFPGVGIVEIEQEFNGNYEIELENGYELYFNSEGDLIYEDDDDEYEEHEGEMDVPISELPMVIVNYIVENYPNSTIAQADILDDGSYKVRTSEDLELYFDAEGNLLNVETEFRLEMGSLSFPDTVQIGQEVILEAYVRNVHFSRDFSGDLSLPYDIEDILPPSLNAATQDGGLDLLENIQIPAKDSTLIEIPVTIDDNFFNQASYDIIIVWPEVVSSSIQNPFVLGGGHDYVKTYVTPL